MSALVGTTVENGVAVVTLNRPDKHNALNDEMVDQLHDALARAIEAKDSRAVLLRAEGPSFSSGRDTTELGRRNANESDYTFVRRHQDERLRQFDSPKPIVAALRGYVLGGAFEIALAADMRVSATDARMGFPEIRFGLVSDTGGTPLTTILAGPSKAKFLLMTGELIDAAQALSWGLVDWVVEPEQLDAVALEIAERLAAAPPIAVAAIKQIVDDTWRGAVRAGMRAELLAQSSLFASADHAEAKAAYRESRPPRFEGK